MQKILMAIATPCYMNSVIRLMAKVGNAIARYFLLARKFPFV